MFRADQSLASQWWSLITAPLLHTNSYHLAMNLLAFLVIPQLSDSSLKLWRMPLLTLLFGAASTLGFAWLNQELSSLVGLSGALHGVVAYLAIREWRSAPGFMTVLAAGLVLKVAIEAYYGGSVATAELIQAQVATTSHLAGAIAGALLAGLLELFQGKSPSQV